MSLRSRKDLWLLIEWSVGSRDVVNVNDVINPSRDQVKVGSVVTLSVSEDAAESMTATVIGKSHDRDILEHQVRINAKTEGLETADQPANEVPEEGRDFSPSGSSWAPSNKSESSTSEDSEVENKKIKLDYSCQRQHHSESRTKKVMVPQFRATPVIPNGMRQDGKNIMNGDLRTQNGPGNIQQSTFPQNNSRSEVTTTSKQNLKQDVLEIVDIFRELFNAVEELKPQSKVNLKSDYDIQESETLISNYHSEDERSMSDVSDRSDDNILITNKYEILNCSKNSKKGSIVNSTPKNISHKVYSRSSAKLMKTTDDHQTTNKSYTQNAVEQNVPRKENFDSRIARLSSQRGNTKESPKNYEVNGKMKEPRIVNVKSEKIKVHDKYNFENGEEAGAIENPVKTIDEWVPIGTGNTLIHKDKFRKVNWKSYTFATRTLLLAAFPRRILATHSLTGKQSPAFHNKPAKMCLDPKIVSDVIIEITDRFSVRENLVRSIITTKCADEGKMLKMRLAKKKNCKEGVNQENIPPQDNDNP